MIREYLKCWKKPEEERAGGNELERSESSFPPATSPTEESLAESQDESLVRDDRGATKSTNTSQGTENVPLANDLHKADVTSTTNPVAEVLSDNDAALENNVSAQAESDFRSVSAMGSLPDDDLTAVNSLEDADERELREASEWEDAPPLPPPNLRARKKGTLAKPPERTQTPITSQQKLLLLDTWMRSGLPARDYGALVNVSRYTL